MDDNTRQLLEQLAGQLGTTVEYLWGVLIRQAYVSAIYNSIWIAIGVIVIGLMLFLIRAIASSEDGLEDGEPMFMAILLTILIAVALLIGPVRSLLTALLNPEYYALQQILDAIR